MSAELKPLPPSTASVSSTEKAHLEYSLKSLATILPLKSKLSGKFQRCNVIEIVEFPKMSIKIKTFKTFCESQTTIHLKKIIRNRLPPPPLPDKSFLRLWYKSFQTLIYGNIETFAFQVLRECSSLAPRNGAVQMFFLTPARNMFLAVLWDYIFCNVE